MAMGRSGEVFVHTYKIVNGQAKPETVLTSTAYPASGSYIDVSGCERFHCLIHWGTIAGGDTPVATLQETDSASGTLDDIDTTYAKHTGANDDDGEWVSFTVEVDQLATDHHFVACTLSGISGSTYGEIFFLLPLMSLPVTQTTTVLPSASQHELVG